MTTWGNTPLWQFCGYPLAVLMPWATRDLCDAEDMFLILEQFVKKPIREILTVNPEYCFHFSHDENGRIIKVPDAPPTPKECTLIWSRHFESTHGYILDKLKDAELHAEYKIASVAEWGDPPPNLKLLQKPIPVDFTHRLQFLRACVSACERAVLHRQSLLELAVILTEKHPVGEVFQHNDRRMRDLVQDGFLERSKRDANGCWWARL